MYRRPVRPEELMHSFYQRPVRPDELQHGAIGDFLGRTAKRVHKYIKRLKTSKGWRYIYNLPKKAGKALNNAGKALYNAAGGKYLKEGSKHARSAMSYGRMADANIRSRDHWTNTSPEFGSFKTDKHGKGWYEHNKAAMDHDYSASVNQQNANRSLSRMSDANTKYSKSPAAWYDTNIAKRTPYYDAKHQTGNVYFAKNKKKKKKR
jgi:hypothetical protein